MAMAAPAVALEEELSYPIHLCDRIKKSAAEATFFKLDCSELSKHVDRLSHMLRAAVRLSTFSSYAASASSSASAPASVAAYDRPIRCVAADVSRNLNRALTLVRKCRRRSILRRVVDIVTAADFRKLFSLLDTSAADLRWLLSILDRDGGGGGIVLSLPPIASNDPILAWIWSFISVVQMGQLSDRIEAANELASLALDNDRNKKIIAEEGGIPPLLKLLKEDFSPEAQIAASAVLINLANDQDRANSIVQHLGVPLIVQVLHNSPTKVQISVARLVARMAEFDSLAREEFARENAIRPLVSLLSFETFDEDDQKLQLGSRQRQSFHSIVQFNNEIGKKEWRTSSSSSFSNSFAKPNPRFGSTLSFQSDGGSSKGGSQSQSQHKKERENESPEIKRELKISCAEALWMLAKGSVLNSTRITETKGLLCLAKLVEKEDGELQKRCLVTVMEITAAAESNQDLRRSAFKTNSPAAKAVVTQLLRLVNESGHDPSVQIPAIRSIGHLSRTFPARETRVMGPLVDQLSSKDQEVAIEAVIALEKFATPDNFLCNEHSKSIIEFNAVLPLMRLLRGNDRAQLHALVLLCYLAISASNNEELEQARVLTALEGAHRSAAAQQQPDLKDLITKAVYHLRMYNDGVLVQGGQSFSL